MINEEIAPWLRAKTFEPVFPLNKEPGGDLLFRITQMIESSNLALFDCTTFNPNVIFELGYAIGKGKPFFVLYKNNFEDSKPLPNILKNPWGIWYDSIINLKSQLEKIISREYQIGSYEYTTNELQQGNTDIAVEKNLISVIIDSKNNYSNEIEQIKRFWDNANVYLINMDLENNLANMIAVLKKSAITICILNPIDEFNNAEINSLKLLGYGIAIGFNRNSILFQQGEKDYSDTMSITFHYNNIDQFQDKIHTWNKKISEKEIKKGKVSKRLGTPNLSRFVSRKRLNDFITKNLFSKILLVRAPSGYGKSALLLDALSEKGYSLIWYTFDNQFKDGVEFVDDVLSEIQKYKSSVGSNFLSVMTSINKGEMSKHNLIAYFCNELENLKSKIVLVLDDVHLLNEKEPQQYIQILFHLIPKNVALIILTREELSFTTKDQQIKNIVELGKEELEFNKSEIREYIEKSSDLLLNPEELELLSQKSEGWIASITLLQSIVAQKGKGSIPEIIRRLRGTDVIIYDYFASIVFENFDISTKYFLLRTSVLNLLTPQSVSFVLRYQIDEAIEGLRRLQKKNSFLFNYENSPDIFRYHSLFKEFLYKKFEAESGEIESESLKYELSKFYLEQQEYFEAIYFGINGKNYDSTVYAILKVGPIALNEGWALIFVKWMSAIPTQYFENNFELLLLKGRAEEQIGMLKDAEVSFKQADALIINKIGREKERNRIRFFLNRVKFMQDTKLEELEADYKEIMVEAKKYKDESIYFASAESLFSIKSHTLLHGNTDSKHRKISEYKKTIQDIDFVLEELSYSNIDNKNIFRSQILIDKAKFAHYVNWFTATEMVRIQLLNNVLHIDVSEERMKPYIDEILKSSELESQCFKESIEIVERDNELLVKANLLVERATISSSRFTVLALYFGKYFPDYVDSALDDLMMAQSIYSKFGQHYGVAMTYNNIAQTLLLKNDRINRDKYANIALTLARKHGFSVIERKANEVLTLLTIKEMHRNSATQASDAMKEGMTEEDKEQFLETMLEAIGTFPSEEKEKRKFILKAEIEDIEYQKQLSKNWCKHIDVFHTNNPLSKHQNTSNEIIEAYLLEKDEAVSLYDSKRDDYGYELNAKFIYCKLLRYHSEKLGERVKDLSNEFIGKNCSLCSKRENG